MGTFFKKDMLIFWRDKKSLILILLMPFVLIVILASALQSIMGVEEKALNIKVGWVNEDDEAAGIQSFLQGIDEISLPTDVKSMLTEEAERVAPLRMLQEVLASEELIDVIAPIELDMEQANQALREQEIAVVLHIPKDFTYHALHKMLLKTGEGSTLGIITGDHSVIESEVFKEIITSFTQTLNAEVALGQMLESYGSYDYLEGEEQLGSRETINQKETLSSKQYYTLSMTVMFVLFVATQISIRSYIELHDHTFNRLLLTGMSSFRYLSGKVFSAASITILQIFVLFGTSHLLFKVFAQQTYMFWLLLGGVVLLLALCVGALAALLTALNFRFNSDASSSFFGNGVVALMSFVGGSFLPVSSFPEWLGKIGQWTPNGLALSAFLVSFQDGSWASISHIMLKLGLLTLVLLIASIWMFPKRSVS